MLAIIPHEIYSVTVPYLKIRPARAAISSFAAQIVKTWLIEEAQAGIEDDNRMHASIKTNNDSGRVEWASISASLIPTVQSNLSQYMSLSFLYMLQITSPRPQKQKGVIAICVNCPPKLVSDSPDKLTKIIPDRYINRNTSPL